MEWRSRWIGRWEEKEKEEGMTEVKGVAMQVEEEE